MKKGGWHVRSVSSDNVLAKASNDDYIHWYASVDQYTFTLTKDEAMEELKARAGKQLWPPGSLLLEHDESHGIILEV